jgi:alpha-tubulin suppressor-like RCC1 family protein
MSKVGKHRLVYAGYIEQLDSTSKWPRTKAFLVQIRVNGNWRPLVRQKIRFRRGYSQTFRIYAELPAGRRSVVARYVLRSGKRTLLRSRPQVVSRPGTQLKVRSVSNGYGQACAVLSNHRAACWGLNKYGELGLGDRQDRLLPTLVRRLGKVRSISAADSYGCAIRMDYRLMCWGNNYDGVLGTGNGHDSLRPKLVKRLRGVRQVSTSTINACAVRWNGRVYCWGNDGGGNDRLRLKPTRVRGIDDATSVSADTYRSCAVRKSHRVVCWSNRTFELRARPAYGEVKTLVPSLDFGCASRVTNRLVCWGDNWTGQLGNGTTKPRRAPGRVPGLGPVRSVSTDGFSVCAVRFSGRVLCWGATQGGDFDLEPAESHLRPTILPGIKDARTVDGLYPGGFCAIRMNRSVLCWGDNSTGSFGNGTTTDNLLPTPVLGGNRF